MQDENQNPPADDVQNPPIDEPQVRNDFEEKYLRACADLENFRKQVERDKIERVKFANENCLVALLPVFENFKRASAHLPENLQTNDWANGIAAIEKQFEATLASLGLRKVAANVGDEFDAHRHEVIATGAGESGKILDLVEEGFELNGKILRAAKVRVGK
ncbi:MAG: nucleotide exchange factor GrpE [Patescibacteria group bacterium]